MSKKTLRHTHNNRNSNNPLYKLLTRLTSGPITNYRRQQVRNITRRNLKKYVGNIHSTDGKSFKLDRHNEMAQMSPGNLMGLGRAHRYVDFNEMEFMPEIAAALTLIADEMTTHSSLEPMLKVRCSNEEIRAELEILFHDILNVNYNLHGWCRSMCKYGDLFLYLDTDERDGIRGIVPLPPEEVDRLEGEDPDNPNYVQFQWNAGKLTFESWQIAHFRILGNDKYYPLGTSVLDPARRIYRQLVLIENAMMNYRIVRAPERRVFYIEVGNEPQENHARIMEEVRKSIRRNRVMNPEDGRADLRFNPLPVKYDTVVPLLDGTKKTILEMAKDYDNGKTNWVYSIKDGEQKVVPGKVVWCGKNYTAKKVYKVWLDDQTYIETAGEHPFLMRDGSKKRADELKEGDSLMPFYRDKNNRGYERIYNPRSQSYELTHRLVAKDIYEKEFEETAKPVIHHVKCWEGEVKGRESRRSYYKNHKVSRVEILFEDADVYCMTVEGLSGEQDRHNFAVCSKNGDGEAVKNGVFVLNSSEEDFFLPMKGGQGSRIDTLPGGQYVGVIDDVKYLRDKLISALQIPASYISKAEGGAQQQSLAQEDLRFSRTVQRLQMSVISELLSIARVHLFIKGFRGEDLLGFDLLLNNPSKIAEMQELEQWRTRFDVASAATEGYFSKRWISKRLFGLSEDEIQQNFREMFYDRQLDAELEAIANPPEAEGGGSGDFGFDDDTDLEGEGEEFKTGDLLAFPEEESPPPPGRRDTATTTPDSKGKIYYPVKDDKRDMAARKRHIKSLYDYESGTHNRRNVFPGSKGIMNENQSDEENQIIQVNEDVRSLLESIGGINDPDGEKIKEKIREAKEKKVASKIKNKPIKGQEIFKNEA